MKNGVASPPSLIRGPHPGPDRITWGCASTEPAAIVQGPQGPFPAAVGHLGPSLTVFIPFALHFLLTVVRSLLPVHSLIPPKCGLTPSSVRRSQSELLFGVDFFFFFFGCHECPVSERNLWYCPHRSGAQGCFWRYRVSGGQLKHWGHSLW